MITLYFFAPSMEYKWIYKIISTFQALQEENYFLILCEGKGNNYKYYVAPHPKVIPDELYKLKFLKEFCFDNNELINYIKKLRELSANDTFRFCSLPNLAETEEKGISFCAGKLISMLEPESLLFITDNNTENDVIEYLQRNPTSRKQQLPMIEMSALCIHKTTLEMALKPDLERLTPQIINPKPITTPFFHNNKTLTIYISDVEEFAEYLALCGSENEPYLTVGPFNHEVQQCI